MAFHRAKVLQWKCSYPTLPCPLILDSQDLSFKATTVQDSELPPLALPGPHTAATPTSLETKV